MGASVTGQTRPRRITLRATAAEADEIQFLAVNDKSVSAYIRRLIEQDKKRNRRTK